ncbi:MAG: LysR family transcriptional regulator, partial [Lachnospiraceae bacterium]|nr:LysR family transcriptional regulator [Lachnospiraceae bacterium]
LSQSTVSSHIKNLEKELQCQLIVRTTRSLKLTAEGETFLPYAKRITQTRDAALTSLKQTPQAVFRLGASSIPSAWLLPNILSRFHEDHPGISYDVQQKDSAGIYEMVMDGTIDLGLIGQKYSSSRCEFIPFCHDQLFLVMPATEPYLRLKAEKTDIRRILEYPFIMRKHGSGTWSAAVQALEPYGVSARSLHVVLSTNDLQSLLQMVAGGMGISICSEYSIRGFEEQKRVISYPLGEKSRRCFYICRSLNRQETPLMRQFIRCAVETCSAQEML